MTRYIQQLRKHFRQANKPVFSYVEILALGMDEPYAKQLIHYLIKRGEVSRVRKGWYTYHSDPTVFIFTLPPDTAYYGLGFASHLHGCWEQSANTELLTYIAPHRIRTSTYVLAGQNIIVRKIARHMFFGYTYINYGTWAIPVSSPEKTLIDLVYYKYPFEDEILPQLMAKIDKRKLKTRLSGLPEELRKRILLKIRMVPSQPIL